MNLNDNITRRINLDENDGLSSFMGLHAQQTDKVYEVFYNFLNKTKPKRILEIGTALGGFTQFLQWASNEIKHPIDILSYDIVEYDWYKDIIKTGIDIRIKNVFYENYQNVDQEVIDFIQQDGLTLVLCDGGDKMLGTLPPYRSALGASPANEALRIWLTTSLELCYLGRPPPNSVLRS